MKSGRVNYRAIRESMGLSQQDVADISNVSRTTVSRLESGSSTNESHARQVLKGLRVEGTQRPLARRGRPTEPTYQVASTLNRALANLNVTQSEVADLLGVSPQAMHNYTTGHRRMSKTVVETFNVFFGINLRK